MQRGGGSAMCKLGKTGWRGRPLYPCYSLNFTLKMMGALGADRRMANRKSDQ